MGSRVRIRIFDILHFVRDLLFPLLGGVRFGGQGWGLLIINIGRVGDKSFIEFLKKWRRGGGRVSGNNILTFLILLAR